MIRGASFFDLLTVVVCEAALATIVTMTLCLVLRAVAGSLRSMTPQRVYLPVSAGHIERQHRKRSTELTLSV